MISYHQTLLYLLLGEWRWMINRCCRLVRQSVILVVWWDRYPSLIFYSNFLMRDVSIRAVSNQFNLVANYSSLLCFSIHYNHTDSIFTLWVDNHIFSVFLQTISHFNPNKDTLFQSFIWIIQSKSKWYMWSRYWVI